MGKVPGSLRGPALAPLTGSAPAASPRRRGAGAGVPERPRGPSALPGRWLLAAAARALRLPSGWLGLGAPGRWPPLPWAPEPSCSLRLQLYFPGQGAGAAARPPPAAPARAPPAVRARPCGSRCACLARRSCAAAAAAFSAAAAAATVLWARVQPPGLGFQLGRCWSMTHDDGASGSPGQDPKLCIHTCSVTSRPLSGADASSRQPVRGRQTLGKRLGSRGLAFPVQRSSRTFPPSSSETHPGFFWYCEGPALISEHLLGTSSVLSMAVPIVYGEHGAAHASRGDEVQAETTQRDQEMQEAFSRPQRASDSLGLAYFLEEAGVQLRPEDKKTPGCLKGRHTSARQPVLPSSLPTEVGRHLRWPPVVRAPD
ncbi:Terminal Uridylyltransferase 4 [Manis pentadactyla]|nr:Terminal Uridylyltransferase 4 [Manis pentadactyla]